LISKAVLGGWSLNTISFRQEFLSTSLEDSTSHARSQTQL
jgi:hypothetical protein